jgi:hypothetical protein
MLMLSVPVLSQARLVDTFGKITCEEMLARTDVFRIELERETSSTGVVILWRGKTTAHYADRSRAIVWSSIRRNDFGLSERVNVYKIDDPDIAKTEFWIIPAGAKPPETAREVWSAEKDYDLTKPFMFGFEDDSGVCPTFVPREYAELIQVNPKILGKIIIHPERGRRPIDIARQWLRIFVSEYKLPRSRLKVVYGKRSDSVSYTEFWLEPRLH